MRTEPRSHRRHRGTGLVIATAAAALALPTAAIAQGPAVGGQNGAEGQSTKASASGEGVPFPEEDWTAVLKNHQQVGGDEYEPVFDSEGHILYQGINKAADPSEQTLVAIDTATGQVDWRLSGVSAGCGVVASDDGMIYGTTAVTGLDELLAIDARTGAIVDRTTPQIDEGSGPEGSFNPCRESLRLADDGTLIALNSFDFDMHMMAFDTDGGLSHRWTNHYHVEDGGGADAESTSELARPVISADGTSLYHCREVLDHQRPNDSDDLLQLEKIDVATGTVVDRVNIHENAHCHTAGVIAVDGGVVVGTSSATAEYKMLHVADAGNGSGNDLSIRWQTLYSRNDDIDQSGIGNYPSTTLSLSGDTIVFRQAGSGTFTGADLASGDVLWHNSVGLNGPHATVDRLGNLYTASHDWGLTSFSGEGNPRFAVERDELHGDDTPGSTFRVQMVVVGPDGGVYLRGEARVDEADGSQSSFYSAFVRVDTGAERRVAGLTRYDTAAKIALNNFRTGVDTVFLAVGTNFPDALTGGPLAAHLNAPVLLADTTSLPSETRSALDRLRPNTVVALGGTGAISDEVLAEAGDAAEAADTGRIFGASRYGTAAAIAERLPASDTVYLAVGTNYPDTLAGGPATDGAPILLTETNHLPQETIAVLQDRQPARVIGLGGSVAIANDVLAQAGQAAGDAQVERLKGQSRYGTGVEIAQTVVDDASFAGTVYVAVGTNYPDAVSAASAAQAAGAPIVLTATDHLPDEVATWLAGLDALRHVVILGGTTAISDDVAADLAALVD